MNSKEEEDNTLVINSIVKNMTDEKRLELAKLLSKEGFRLLLKLLDPDNQSLLNLPEKKKRAALRLESMSEEQFREILSKIEGNTDLPQEEMNVFTKKRLVNIFPSSGKLFGDGNYIKLIVYLIHYLKGQ